LTSTYHSQVLIYVVVIVTVGNSVIVDSVLLTCDAALFLWVIPDVPSKHREALNTVTQGQIPK